MFVFVSGGDTCVNMGRVLNEYATPDAKRNFTMISSAKAPPFTPAYLDTKIEAENYLKNECPNLVPYIIRPGFIWNQEHRGWSIPLKYVCDLLYCYNENIGKKLPGAQMLDQLFPAKPTKLETVGHFAVESVMGNLDAETHQMIMNDMMIAYEAEQK